MLGQIAGNSALEVILLAVRGYLEAMQNRIHEARDSFDQGRARMEEMGDVIWLYWLFALMADPISGERELRWATELLDKIGEGSHYTSTAAVLARGTRPDAQTAVGRLDELPTLATTTGEGPALLVIGEVVARSTAWRAEIATLASRLEAA